MNNTIYHAINQCSTTGLECELKSLTLESGHTIRLFVDHKRWHRIVAFKSIEHSKGYAGVIVMPDGEIYYKETCPAMRGKGITRQLQALLTVWGIKWYPSQYQTAAGAACYHSNA